MHSPFPEITTVRRKICSDKPDIGLIPIPGIIEEVSFIWNSWSELSGEDDFPKEDREQLIDKIKDEWLAGSKYPFSPFFQMYISFWG